jgi:hypothetical protein
MPLGQAKDWLSLRHTSRQWLAEVNGTQLACASAPEGAAEQSASEVQRLAHAQPAATLGIWLLTPKQGTAARLHVLESPWHSSA